MFRDRVLLFSLVADCSDKATGPGPEPSSGWREARDGLGWVALPKAAALGGLSTTEAWAALEDIPVRVCFWPASRVGVGQPRRTCFMGERYFLFCLFPHGLHPFRGIDS